MVDKPKERVGFIGLGIMGKPMAQNLLRNGFDVVIHDLRKEPLDELKKLGAVVATSPKETGAISAVTIVMVFTLEQAEKVIMGAAGILEGANAGSLIIVMSTVGPSFCKKAARVAAEKGVGLIDAPVAGEPGRAVEGTLTIMVGGEDRWVRKGWPVLETMGKDIFHIGDVGAGQIVKLANNYLANNGYFATTEAIALVKKAGVKLEQFLELARKSSAIYWAVLDNQRWLAWRKRKLESGPDDHPWAMTHKDLKATIDVAREFGLDLKHLEFMFDMDVRALLESFSFPEGR